MGLPMRGIIWLVLLGTGSLALPPPLQGHLRGSVRAKQTTPIYSSENGIVLSPKVSSSVPKPVSLTSATMMPVTMITAPEPASPYSPLSPVLPESLRPSQTPSQLDTAATTRTTTAAVAAAAATTATTTTTMPSTTVATVTTMTSRMIATAGPGKPTATGTATGTGIGAVVPTSTISSNVNSSASPIETSSRTISSAQDDDTTFLSSSRKSTAISTEFTTTAAPISAKETRESPGKIRPQIKITTNYTSVSETGVRLPEGASAALAKPTKYHYYPHNQHIYLLPECAVQQVCNAVYVRLNFTQPLCACPGRYRDPCSASLDSDDLHTTELVTDPRTKALTLVKTCEPVAEMRECRTPRDWSLLALQNVRTGKSHYLVICRCPDANILEGPMSHDQPTYASVPGIRVYGMMCVQGNRRGRPLRHTRSLSVDAEEEKNANAPYNVVDEDGELPFPWYKVQQLMNAVIWD